MVKAETESHDSKLRTPDSHEHGGNIYRAAVELGIPEDKLIDFSASINPLGVSKKVKDAIRRGMDGLVNYPDPYAVKLGEKLALLHDIDPATILCGNGSTELIYLIPRVLKPGSALIPAPTFSEYERACRISDGLIVVSYKLSRENDFRMNPDEFIELLSLNSATPYGIAFLCNPNNPTGHLLRKDAVLKIAEAAKGMRCYLVVDEAFIDFHPEESVISEVRQNPYLIVLRSMTKFYALTGLRVGYGVFHRSVIKRMRDFKEPWTMNNLAQEAAAAALEDTEYKDKTFGMIVREKRFLEDGFRRAGIEFFPSDVNFYLLSVEAQLAVPFLRSKGILVRDCSNFKGLEGSCIRVAVKSRKHNRMLLKELVNLLRSDGKTATEKSFLRRHCRSGIQGKNEL